MTALSPRARANLMLLAAAIIWGLAFVAQSDGNAVGSFTFNASRFLLGAVSLLPVVWWSDARAKLSRRDALAAWRPVIVPGLICAVFLFVGASFQQVGLNTTTAGNAAFITGLYVVMVPLAGLVFFKHKLGRNTWVGAVLAVIGLFLLTILGGDNLRVNPGDVLCLVGTLGWTSHIIAVGIFAKRLDPLRLSVAQFTANGLYSAVAAFVAEKSPFTGLETVLWPLAFAGIASVGIAYTLQVLGQEHARSADAALILSLETVFGAIGGAWLLGERMTIVGYLGAALMFAGIVWSQLEPRAKPAVGALTSASDLGPEG